MRVRMNVTYADGRVVSAIANARAQVATERAYHGMDEQQRVELSYHLAWAALHHAGQETADFETWLDLIEDVDEVAEVTGAAGTAGTADG